MDHPWDVGFAGSTMIYTERAGRITAVVGGQKRLLAAPADVVNASEAGMMGLAVDPEFAANRYIYVCLASTLRPEQRRAPGALDGGRGLHHAHQPDQHLHRGSGEHRRRAGPALRLPAALRSAGPPVGGHRRRRRGHRAPEPHVPWRQGPAHEQGRHARGRQSRRRAGPADLLVRAPERPVDRLPRSDGLAVQTEHGPDRTTSSTAWCPGTSAGTGRGREHRLQRGRAHDRSPEVPERGARPLVVGPPTVAPSGATFVSGAQWGNWNNALVVGLLKGSALLVFKLDGRAV